MRPAPDFDRIVKSVRHNEPDRVPLCEALVEYPIMSRFLGREVRADDLQSQVEFWTLAGYDYIPLVTGMMTPGKVTENSAISRAIKQRLLDEGEDATGDAWSLEYTSFVRTWEDFDRFPWELAAGTDDAEKFSSAAALLPEGMKIIALTGKIYTLSWMLMGFESFAMSIAEGDELSQAVMKQVGDAQFAAVDRVLSLPYVGAVWAVDDIASGSGTMLSPALLRTHLFPWYREMASRCHAAGKLFFFHSDGDLLPVMEDLIELGVDALHPIDPTAMDIAQVKKDYGDRIALIGNVFTELLRSGTPAEVEAAVEQLLRTAASGGGYCLGSGNSFHNGPV